MNKDSNTEAIWGSTVNVVFCERGDHVLNRVMMQDILILETSVNLYLYTCFLYIHRHIFKKL